ncbi:ABC transporter ATP-binding protein [Haloplasma contractile]|uniref:ATP-binding cassette subfamily B bacterial MsbA protein n=1 Tax=Haloplasma contractile SSD-17B TaxID=1033810 RepID=F7PVC1_9MOLU|nr:ABC transporter ATP-binding protein [Haloplasma contractile]ERJ12914.1 ATP-binding cassette subfamily B bacterial MsbA protein [Haloplasma contractile SSD-17B]
MPKKDELGINEEQHTKHKRFLFRRQKRRRRNQKPDDAKNTIKRLIKYLSFQKKRFVIVLILISIKIAIDLSAPLLIAHTIDTYIIPVDGGAPSVTGVLQMVTYLILMYIVLSAFTYLQSHVMIGITQSTLKKMRQDLFEKVQTLSIKFFDKNKDGDLVSRLTSDIDEISNTLTGTVIQLYSSVVLLLGTAILMFSKNWQLALISLISIPLIYITTRIISKYSRRQHRKLRYQFGDVTGYVQETINGHSIIKSFSEEERMVDLFYKENDDLAKKQIKARIISNSLGPILSFINNLRYGIIIGAGAFFIVLNASSFTIGSVTFILAATTIGTLAAFIQLAQKFDQPIRQLSNLFTNIQNALASAERIFDILDDDAIIENKEDAIDLDHITGHVEFKQVSFSYIKDEPVLKGINLTANPGERIALVGHTGAGKTTIINLLTRFYDIDDGEILVDGHNLKDVTKQSLRNKIGIVLQDTNLFTGTIKENIRYGKLDATDEEIVEACKLARVHDFIDQLDDGYDTHLEKNGTNLSHGQRQLLSIARTILKDPDILILDEATSSVDTRTELRIQEGMNNLMKGRTSFIIAHRLSTIRDADAILVMEEGEIKERGNHHELLDLDGIYAELHNSMVEEQVPIKTAS